jgi:hypothetical protein
MTEEFDEKSRRRGRGLGAVRRIQKLGRAIGRQGPPPGMVPFEGDGDGDGYENDEDPMKRRWVGFQKPDLALPAPPGAAVRRELLNASNKVDKYIDKTMRLLRSKRKTVKAKAVKNQKNRSVKKSNIDRVHILEAAGKDHSTYRYEPPELTIRDVDGTYTDFVTENHKVFPWGEDFDSWKENYEPQLANMISLILNKMANEDSNTLRVPPDVIALELDMDPEDRVFEKMLNQRNPQLYGYESVFDLMSDGWGFVENADGQRVTDPREIEMVRKYIESAMEQSETFAELVKIFGLPLVTPLRPQPPRPELLRQAQGIEEIAAAGEAITNLHANYLGAAFDGSIFLQLIDLLDGNDSVDLDAEVDSNLDFIYGNSGFSPETTLRHEFAHYLDSQGEGIIRTINNATEEQEKAVKEAFAEIREINEKALENALKEYNVKEALRSIDELFKALGTALSRGQMDVNSAQLGIEDVRQAIGALTQSLAMKTFPWISAYGVSDIINYELDPTVAKAKISVGPQMEFIAELMAMATSPNQEVRDFIDPQYAQVLKKMFNSLGIEWG